MERQSLINAIYVMVALLGILWLQSLIVESRQVEQITYSEFQRHLAAGQIREITVTSNTILSQRRDSLERGAQLLLERETLGEEDLAALREAAPVVAMQAKG